MQSQGGPGQPVPVAPQPEQVAVPLSAVLHPDESHPPVSGRRHSSKTRRPSKRLAPKRPSRLSPDENLRRPSTSHQVRFEEEDTPREAHQGDEDAAAWDRFYAVHASTWEADRAAMQRPPPKMRGQGLLWTPRRQREEDPWLEDFAEVSGRAPTPYNPSPTAHKRIVDVFSPPLLAKTRKPDWSRVELRSRVRQRSASTDAIVWHLHGHHYGGFGYNPFESNPPAGTGAAAAALLVAATATVRRPRLEQALLHGDERVMISTPGTGACTSPPELHPAPEPSTPSDAGDPVSPCTVQMARAWLDDPPPTAAEEPPPSSPNAAAPRKSAMGLRTVATLRTMARRRRQGLTGQAIQTKPPAVPPPNAVGAVTRGLVLARKVLMKRSREASPELKARSHESDALVTACLQRRAATPAAALEDIDGLVAAAREQTAAGAVDSSPRSPPPAPARWSARDSQSEALSCTTTVVLPGMRQAASSESDELAEAARGHDPSLSAAVLRHWQRERSRFAPAAQGKRVSIVVRRHRASACGLTDTPRSDCSTQVEWEEGTGRRGQPLKGAQRQEKSDRGRRPAAQEGAALRKQAFDAPVRRQLTLDEYAVIVRDVEAIASTGINMLTREQLLAPGVQIAGRTVDISTWNRVDRDGTGTVTLKDLLKYWFPSATQQEISTIMRTHRQRVEQARRGEGTPWIDRYPPGMLNEVADIFDMLDRDGKGRLEFRDLQRLGAIWQPNHKLSCGVPEGLMRSQFEGHCVKGTAQLAFSGFLEMVKHAYVDPDGLGQDVGRMLSSRPVLRDSLNTGSTPIVANPFTALRQMQRQWQLHKRVPWHRRKAKVSAGKGLTRLSAAAPLPQIPPAGEVRRSTHPRTVTP